MEAALRALQAFNIKGAVTEIALFGLGHINDSYLVKTKGQNYLLQRLNKSVFQSPEIVESNLKALLSQDSNLFVKHYKTSEGDYHFQSANQNWRLMDFIDEAYAPETANNLDEVKEVAEGFGRFTAFAEELDINHFQETIPNFHDLDLRLNQLTQAIEKDAVNRVDNSKDLIERVETFQWISKEMKRLKAEGLPKRVCHNDTKLNNCLLNETNQNFQYIIDLDTSGPGYVLFDFGDLMRTTLSPTAENEPDGHKIEIREDYLHLLREGFISGSNNRLSSVELESLEFGGMYMTFIMAIRFLTDHLIGDIYYKTSFENENFIRARNQLRLLELMSEL